MEIPSHMFAAARALEAHRRETRLVERANETLRWNKTLEDLYPHVGLLKKYHQGGAASLLEPYNDSAAASLLEQLNKHRGSATLSLLDQVQVRAYDDLERYIKPYNEVSRIREKMYAAQALLPFSDSVIGAKSGVMGAMTAALRTRWFDAMHRAAAHLDPLADLKLAVKDYGILAKYQALMADDSHSLLRQLASQTRAVADATQLSAMDRIAQSMSILDQWRQVNASLATAPNTGDWQDSILAQAMAALPRTSDSAMQEYVAELMESLVQEGAARQDPQERSNFAKYLWAILFFIFLEVLIKPITGNYVSRIVDQLDPCTFKTCEVSAKGVQQRVALAVSANEISPMMLLAFRFAKRPLQVRRNGRKGSQVVGTLEQGQVVEVIEVDGAWTKVRTHSESKPFAEGWVFTRYLLKFK